MTDLIVQALLGALIGIACASVGLAAGRRLGCRTCTQSGTELPDLETSVIADAPERGVAELHDPKTCDHDWRVSPDGWKPSVTNPMNASHAALLGNGVTTLEEVRQWACARCARSESEFRRVSLVADWPKLEEPS